jgi:hypothetical protein
MMNVSFYVSFYEKNIDVIEISSSQEYLFQRKKTTTFQGGVFFSKEILARNWSTG